MGKAVYSPDYKQILGKLKAARLRSGLNQSEVAQQLGRPQSYISKIEAGERRVDVLELKQLAKIYKKSVSYFYSVK